MKMNKNIILIIVFIFVNSVVLYAQSNLPHLEKHGDRIQLYVHKSPFLILGGELGNSTASNVSYTKPFWPVFKSMGLNTILMPVYWELIEPSENKFDFTSVDSLLADARKNNIKLVLLWFGTWKNSMSSYVPEWVKTNSQKYPRTKDNQNKSQEILSVFSTSTLDADRHAFSKLMQHINLIDKVENTVIMVQVENEIGMLPTAREFSNVANKAFESEIPASLKSFLINNSSKLVPQLKTKWEGNGKKVTGNWSTVFGTGIETDEIFQAWYYASYANQVAVAGKKEYDIPMYVNAALPRKGRMPGEYPSAGPLPHLLNIWQIAAPSIDIFSPDFYNPDIQYWCDLYTVNDNPLFIPEIQLSESCAARDFFLFGHYKSLGFSPFSIENANGKVKTALANSYSVLKLTDSLYLQKTFLNMDGVYLNKGDSGQQIRMGNYLVTIDHELKLPWHSGLKDSTWPASGALIIQISENEFAIAGTGIVATFENIDKNKVANFSSIDEEYRNGLGKQMVRRLNGDESHQGRHVRIVSGEYQLQKIKLYNSPRNIE